MRVAVPLHHFIFMYHFGATSLKNDLYFILLHATSRYCRYKNNFSTFILNGCFNMIGRTRLMTRSLGIFRNSVAHPDIPPSVSSFISLYPLQVRQRSSTPLNTIIMFVPQQEAWVVERMGKFHKILEPGLNMLIPIIDKIKYVQSLKEIAIDVPKQSAITSDNVTLDIDGVLYLRINNPYLTSYGVEDPEFAIIQLAQTTMRSELGKISLDNVFREREGLNVNIVASINKASEVWGITCLRYEIRDIRLPPRIQEAMQMQVEAERRKRATILESEGVRTADINVAEGKRQSRILASEAEKQEQINKASGEANALLAVAEARAKGLEMVANALGIQDGKSAASLSIAEQYVRAFNKLAKTNNTLILPSNVADVSGLVAQALTIYKQILPSDSSNNKSQSYNPRKFDESSEADEVFEYYSDKEEAVKHKKVKSQAPKLL